ncbi:MAG: MFS transporter, partial [Chloroflexi bacterium]|nr:MFS transporter [Chloroflexota bacterium]
PTSAVRQGSTNRWFILSAVVLGNFATFLVGTALNTALPRIIQVFGVAVDEGQLILSTYLVAQAVMVPLVAYISNTVGLRRAFLTTLSLFTFSTMLCALAWDLHSLVFFRVLQGLAGGMTFPLGMTIIFTTVPPEERG